MMPLQCTECGQLSFEHIWTGRCPTCGHREKKYKPAELGRIGADGKLIPRKEKKGDQSTKGFSSS